MIEVDPTRMERYHAAIRILSKDEAWPIFKEWISVMILGVVGQNNQTIITESDKANHNMRVGQATAYRMIHNIDDVVDDMEKWKQKMREKIKEAEDQLSKGETL